MGRLMAGGSLPYPMPGQPTGPPAAAGGFRPQPPTAGDDALSVLIRGLVRAGLVLVAGALGVLAWRAMIRAGMPAATLKSLTPALKQALSRVPPDWSVVANEPVSKLIGQRLATSLDVLAFALPPGVLAGFGASGLRVALGRAQAGMGLVGGGVGRFVGVLWTPPVPVALTVLILATVSGGTRGSGWVLGLAIGGAAAGVVAAAVTERWQRRAWAAGWSAGAAAAGRALAVATGILVVGEAMLARPGVGALLVTSYVNGDGNVVAGVTTLLLGIALAGQVVAALFTALADYLDRAPAQAVPGRAGPATGLLVAALATLAVPVLVVAGSLVAGHAMTFDVTHSMAHPSAAHPLGTDLQGRDVLARLLVGYRHTLLVALAGLALATLPGAVWGALAALVAHRMPRAGGPISEVILGPGRLVMVAPLLLAGTALVGADRWPVVLALAVVLTPRLAVTVAEMARPLPTSPLTVIRTAAGLLVHALGVTVVVLAGLEFIGIAERPPTPALGEVLAETTTSNGQVALAAALTLVAITPFLLAGGALLRHPRQAEAQAPLDT